MSLRKVPPVSTVLEIYRRHLIDESPTIDQASLMTKVRGRAGTIALGIVPLVIGVLHWQLRLVQGAIADGSAVCARRAAA
jgi:hypothetical protein